MSYKQGIPAKTIYIRMAVGTIGFLVLGLYIRNTFDKIREQLEEKRKKEEEEELARAEEEARAQAAQAQTQAPGSTVDYRVDGYGEDFLPLTVSDYIDTKTQN